MADVTDDREEGEVQDEGGQQGEVDAPMHVDEEAAEAVEPTAAQGQSCMLMMNPSVFLCL
jgi:hypothetical protein